MSKLVPQGQGATKESYVQRGGENAKLRGLGRGEAGQGWGLMPIFGSFFFFVLKKQAGWGQEAGPRLGVGLWIWGRPWGRGLRLLPALIKAAA